MGAISRETLEVMLVGHFEETYNRVAKRWHQHFLEMSKEMIGLCQTFGQKAVMTKFASDFGIPFPEIRRKMVGKTNKPVRSASSQSEPKKTRRRRRRCLSYSELRPHIIATIASLPTGSTRDTREIQAMLKEKGLLFRRNHMTMIILRDLAGLEKIGATPRVGKSQPANIYKVVGPVQLRSEVEQKPEPVAQAS